MHDFYKLTILTQRWRNKFQAWADDNSGATAVEFALIAGPFFFLIFGLLELSIVFIVSTTIEHGISEASRQIRTGLAQQNGVNQAQFERDVCDQLFGILDCDNKLSIDVRTFQNFSSANSPSPIDDEGNFASDDFQFSPGNRDEIVVVRVFYEWEIVSPFNSALSNLSNGNLLIESGIAFQNEPFG